MEPRYYSDKNSEIDFLIQNGTEIIPVKVKSGESKLAPFFKRYMSNNHSSLGIRFSKNQYRKDGVIVNIPLYLARKLKTFI